MAVFFKLTALLFLVGFCQGQVSVRSSFEIDGGRMCAGMNEVVVFTCRIEAGTLLAWTVFPLINVTNPVFFLASAPPNEISFRPGVNARVLEPDGSLLVSELRIDATLAEDTLVFCRNNDPESAVSTEYCRRDGSELMLSPGPGIEYMEESAGNEVGTAYMLEAISICLNWSEAANINEIDFLGYQVSVESVNGMAYSAQVSINEVRVTLSAGTYDVNVSVMDLNGNVGVPTRRNITLNARSSGGLIAATVLAVLFFVCCTCMCICFLCLCILYKRKTFTTIDDDEDPEQLKKTIAAQEETIRDLRAKLEHHKQDMEMKPLLEYRGPGSVSDTQ